MFMALGAGAWVAGIFYLFVHGFFKGLLFLGAGSVIHAMSGEQDMRFMGGLRKKLPVTFWTMLIGALAMTGVLPAAGFWAKDEIIGGAAIEGYWIVVVVALVTAFLTSIYMFRLIFLTFFGESRASEEVQRHVHESPATMTVPLVLLAIPSALLGGLVGWPPEAGWMHRFLEPVFFDVHHAEFVWVGEGGGLMLVSLLVVLGALALTWHLYLRRPELPARVAERSGPAYTASLNKLYMDEVFEVAPIRSTIALAHWLWTGIDTLVIDGAVNGLAWVWGRIGVGLRPLQTGRLQNYAFAIFAGMVVLVVVVRWF
jgi:NADH-quinone oxidoreductase subunit L